MHGLGLVLDFEGSSILGFREVGFIIIQDFEIVDAGELKAVEDKNNDKFISILDKDYEFFVSHQSNVEKNFLHRKYPFSQNSDTGTWGPWLDTKIIYQKLYPNLEKFDLKFLVKTFIEQSKLDTLTSKYCAKNKIDYHNALFDSICCYLLARRLIKDINLYQFLS